MSKYDVNTLEEFKAIVAENSKVLVDFYAEWCPPCKMLGPLLEQMDGSKTLDARLVKVNVDVLTELAGDYKITSLPTLVLLKNGEEVRRDFGFKPKELIMEFVKI